MQVSPRFPATGPAFRQDRSILRPFPSKAGRPSYRLRKALQRPTRIYETRMDRTVPVWVFLLSLLMGGLFTVAFGWSIKSALVGNNRGGYFGDIAVTVANFPTRTKDVFHELTDGKDKLIRIPRPDVDLTGFKPGIGGSNL